MGIKADKTFEEIVERLVAIFRPQPPPDKDRTGEGSSQIESETIQITPSNTNPPAAGDDPTP